MARLRVGLVERDGKGDLEVVARSDRVGLDGLGDPVARAAAAQELDLDDLGLVPARDDDGDVGRLTDPRVPGRDDA